MYHGCRATSRPCIVAVVPRLRISTNCGIVEPHCTYKLDISLHYVTKLDIEKSLVWQKKSRSDQDLPGMLGEPQGEPAGAVVAAVAGAKGLLLCPEAANGLAVGPARLRRSSLGLLASVGEPAPNRSDGCWMVGALVLKGLVAAPAAWLLVGDSFNFCSWRKCRHARYSSMCD
jgi:hypothetical protein